MTQDNSSTSASQIADEKLRFARSVFIWIVSTVEVPIMLLTLYALCFLIGSHRAASVYLIHLILSDLVQTVCQVIYTTRTFDMALWKGTFYYSVIVSVYFVACIAFEQYLLVCHPHWYKTHRSLKSSCLISLVVWFVPLMCADIEPPHLHFLAFRFAVVCLIPYLITALCFVGTWRGLSRAISLTPHKRRMILGTLFLVLLSYTFLLLPYIVLFIFHHFTDYTFRFTPSYKKAEDFVFCLVFLNPLADCLLYLFMRSDVSDLMPSLHCCCRSDTQHISARYTTRTIDTQPLSTLD